MKLDDMTPGKELDALVAERVMGWRRRGDMLGPPEGDKRLSWATEWHGLVLGVLLGLIIGIVVVLAIVVIYGG